MRLALKQARLAFEAGEVPVGAVVVHAGEVAGAGSNRTRRDCSVAAHAEIVALIEAERKAGDFRLDDAVMYVTVEPCLMCLGAMQQARIGRVVYGAAEPKSGALGGRFDLRGHEALRKLKIVSGVLAEDAAGLMGEFFAGLREGA
ncbi:nucleoside deaminase [bacterium]|nr:nucleoside deaminase [bacterium]